MPRRLREWWVWATRGQGRSLLGELRVAVMGRPPPPPAPRSRRAVALNVTKAARGAAFSDEELDGIERHIREGGTMPRELTSRLVRHAPLETSMTVARDIEGVALSPRARRMAARAARRKGVPFYTPFYTNPRQGIMYHIIEAVSTQTFCHTVINVFMALVMGTAVRPELYLKKPTGDANKDNAELEKYKWITDVMEEVDRRIGQAGSEVAGRTEFFEHIQNLVRSAIVYNRGALVIHPTVSDIEVDGKLYKGLPGALQFVHGRDLGSIKVDDIGDLLQVAWDQVGMDLPWQNMIYLWNSLQGEERHMTRHYGLSFLDGIMATLRSVYQVLNVDIPACAKATYAGNVIIPYNIGAVDDELKAEELERLTATLSPGGVSVIAAHPEDLDVKPVSVQGDMTTLIAYLDSAYREICSAFRIPQSIIFDEAASNRATMTGKLIYMTRGTIKHVRNWISRAVTPQWYGMMLPLILEQGGHPELADKVGVRIAFDDLNLEGQEDMMDYVSKLVQLVPLKDRAILDLAGHPELITEIDEKKRARMEEMGAAPGMPQLEMGGNDGGEWEGGDAEGDK